MRSETTEKCSHSLEVKSQNQFSLEHENLVTLKLRKFNFEQGFIILHNLVSNSRLMIQTEFIRDTYILHIQCQLYCL